MNSLEQYIVFCVLLIAGIWALMASLVRHITIGWKAKRKDIVDGFDVNARLAYFSMFCRNSPAPSRDNVSREFDDLYHVWYGRTFFMLPGLLLLLVGSVIVTLVTLTGLHRLSFLTNPLFNLPDTALAALAGAYLWVVNDHISRARRLDLAPSDIMWSVLRLIIAIPMGYAFTSILAKPMAPFVAFALGAFPLEALTSKLRLLADKNLGLAGTSEERADDIIELQGLNKAIVERLGNEDIMTVSQIAYCDPIRLTMRSNLSFVFVTDCMNQALAWMYLRKDLDIIRPLGIRGAVEIKYLMDAFDNPNQGPAHALAKVTLPKLALAIKQDSDTLQLAFRHIAEDPYTIFLNRIWTVPNSPL